MSPIVLMTVFSYYVWHRLQVSYRVLLPSQSTFVCITQWRHTLPFCGMHAWGTKRTISLQFPWTDMSCELPYRYVPDYEVGRTCPPWSSKKINSRYFLFFWYPLGRVVTPWVTLYHTIPITGTGYAGAGLDCGSCYFTIVVVHHGKPLIQ